MGFDFLDLSDVRIQQVGTAATAVSFVVC